MVVKTTTTHHFLVVALTDVLLIFTPNPCRGRGLHCSHHYRTMAELPYLFAYFAFHHCTILWIGDRIGVLHFAAIGKLLYFNIYVLNRVFFIFFKVGHVLEFFSVSFFQHVCLKSARNWQSFAFSVRSNPTWVLVLSYII